MASAEYGIFLIEWVQRYVNIGYIKAYYL
jgi:hypothetical protein